MTTTACRLAVDPSVLIIPQSSRCIREGKGEESNGGGAMKQKLEALADANRLTNDNCQTDELTKTTRLTSQTTVRQTHERSSVMKPG